MTIITKVLIANRGEIAIRIARACRDAGMASVAVYADPDADALHVQMADEAWALEGSSATDTYLSIDKLIAVAQRSGANAVHPGYGFLAERADFAQAVQQAGLVWIGPPPAAMEALGDKVAARRIAQKVGAPLVVGSDGPVRSAGEVLAFVREHGLPVAIKAAFGGGGRGLKVAREMDEVAELFDSAVREATAAFGRGECYVEQFLDNPRHIEAQIMADTHGHVVVVGTRDCSLQRRNQKLVEEAPAPFLTDAQRRQIHEGAQAICAEAGYVSAGTVEFLLSQGGQISFLEVNTRLQVEHGITEEVCGVDLVVEQLRVAAGRPLSFVETPTPRGHAFEFRINAEDPGRGFLPTSGTITCFVAPSGPGVRVDSGVTTGSVVAGGFDSLIAKLMVTGATREQALARSHRALAEFKIEGVASVLPFHRAVVTDPTLVAQDGLKVHTRWIETAMQARFEPAARPEPLNAPLLIRTFVEIDGQRRSLALPAGLVAGSGRRTALEVTASDERPTATSEPGTVIAPMAGELLKWNVEEGRQVTEGDVIATLEAMKMEISIAAPATGRLQRFVEVGEQVQADMPVAKIVASSDEVD